MEKKVFEIKIEETETGSKTVLNIVGTNNWLSKQLAITLSKHSELIPIFLDAIGQSMIGKIETEINAESTAEALKNMILNGNNPNTEG